MKAITLHALPYTAG